MERKLDQNLIGEWVGPYLVDGSDQSKELVYVRDAKVGSARPLNISEEIKYLKTAASLHTHILIVAKGLHYRSHASNTFMTEVLDSSGPRTYQQI